MKHLKIILHLMIANLTSPRQVQHTGGKMPNATARQHQKLLWGEAPSETELFESVGEGTC
jgi:hypothetical protein